MARQLTASGGGGATSRWSGRAEDRSGVGHAVRRLAGRVGAPAALGLWAGPAFETTDRRMTPTGTVGRPSSLQVEVQGRPPGVVRQLRHRRGVGRCVIDPTGRASRTPLRLLLGLLEPTVGRAEVSGDPPGGQPPHRLRPRTTPPPNPESGSAAGDLYASAGNCAGLGPSGAARRAMADRVDAGRDRAERALPGRRLSEVSAVSVGGCRWPRRWSTTPS